MGCINSGLEVRGSRTAPKRKSLSDFGFECGVMLSWHVDHLTMPPLGLWQVKMHLIALSEIWGEAHMRLKKQTPFLHHHGVYL
jgi:hypothetical protein